jgi:hypothetical protein
MQVVISPSKHKTKKYDATFSDGSVVSFGAAGYSDFTQHKDEARKANYIKRHQANEDWNNVKTPGFLSRFILWNKPTIQASIRDINDKYKNVKFKLK